MAGAEAVATAATTNSSRSLAQKAGVDLQQQSLRLSHHGTPRIAHLMVVNHIRKAVRCKRSVSLCREAITPLHTQKLIVELMYTDSTGVTHALWLFVWGKHALSI